MDAADIAHGMLRFPDHSITSAASISHSATKAVMDSPQESDEARAKRLQVKTRRRRYLEMHPEYFESPSLELAGNSVWQVVFLSFIPI